MTISKHRSPEFQPKMEGIVKVLHHTHKKRGINKEMKGWRVREIFTPSSSDGDDDEEENGNE